MPTNKIISLISLISILPNVAQAGEEGVVSLFEDSGVTAESTTSETNSPQNDSGLFSFLKFSLPEKDIPTAADKNLPSNIQDTIKLADRGDVKAQLFLGYSYLYGENGLQVDYEKAFNYYGKAALQNDPAGLNNLGSLYYNGIGVKRNTAKSLVLFSKAADLGNSEAAVNAGFILISGNGVKQDKEKAIQYFENASSTDNPTAKFMTGYAYYTGKLRPQNYVKAAPLIKAAADAGIEEAQVVMADVYINGRGFPQNYNNGVKYLQEAVSQGNTEAMMKLADILYTGDKYNKDIEYAHVLYNLASVRGVREAPSKRQMVESKMKINDILQAQLRAENFKDKPSKLTQYIRQTFGADIRSFF